MQQAATDPTTGKHKMSIFAACQSQAYVWQTDVRWQFKVSLALQVPLTWMPSTQASQPQTAVQLTS